MLHKAWPLELKDKNLNEEDKDEILLTHLLTWPIWPGFLKFFGKASLWWVHYFKVAPYSL